jgi:hypothetical protein
MEFESVMFLWPQKNRGFRGTVRGFWQLLSISLMVGADRLLLTMLPPPAPTVSHEVCKKITFCLHDRAIHNRMPVRCQAISAPTFVRQLPWQSGHVAGFSGALERGHGGVIYND